MNETVKAGLKRLASLNALTSDPIYLVGGSVRDTLRGENPADMDFTLRDAPGVAKTLADAGGLPLVPLDTTPGRETFRVVLDKNLFFDFTTLQGKTIEEDLAQRDFTINAMAISLTDFIKGTITPIDPFSGQDDLRNQIIRVVPGPAFEEDPLRLLRAFRFASTLDFTIEPDTLAQIETHKEKLTKTAQERVTYELLILFKADHSNMDAMHQSGLLKILFPSTGGWDKSRNTFEELENILRHPDSLLEHHAPLIEEYISKNHHRALLKWSVLIGTSDKKLPDSGLIDILKRFRLSNTNIQFIEGTLRHSARVLSESRSTTRGFEQRSTIYQLIKDSGNELIASLLLSLAIRLGNQEDIKYFIESLNRILDFYIQTYIPAQDRPALLNGEMLKERFQLTPSPLFKDILDKVEEARVLGTVHNQQEAEQLARKLITSQ